MSKELTPQDFCQETIELQKQLQAGFIELGRRLHKIKTEEMWLAAGYDTFGEYTAELQTSEANASKLISVYQKFVLDYKIPEEKLVSLKSWSSLYMIGSKTNTKEEAEEWIDKAKDLRREDIQRELKEKSVGEHKHEWTHVSFRQCPVCGVREKTYREDL